MNLEGRDRHSDPNKKSFQVQFFFFFYLFVTKIPALYIYCKHQNISNMFDKNNINMLVIGQVHIKI